MQIHTDREIAANKPDIVNLARENITSKLIDMAVPSEKLSKYKDLEIETTRKWGMKTEIIPVVICALGLIKKGLEKHTGVININKLQKITLSGTALWL